MANIEHRPTTRVLDILQLLATSKEGFSLTEIATAIKVPKSTITPIIRTLCDRNFIAPNGSTGKYIIGMTAFIVGSTCLQNMELLNLITAEMKKVVAATSEVCQLGILIDGNVLYVAKEDSPEPIRLISFVGKRLPAYSTALGKALICDLSVDELKKIYKNGLTRITDNTITDFKTLKHELDQIKKKGYAWENEESSKGLNCFAISLRYSGNIVAALSVSIPTFRVTSEKEAATIASLQVAQQNLEDIFKNLSIDNDVFFDSLLAGVK